MRRHERDGRRARFAAVLGAALAVVCGAGLCSLLAGALPAAQLARSSRGASAGGAGQGPAEIEFFTMDMCPYAQRTWIVLEEKGIPYTRTLVDLRNESSKKWYAENVNPLGKVPSVRDASDGTVVYESEVVNEYLEQRFAGLGPALLPPDAAGCAAVRLWNHHLNSKLAPAHFTYLMNKDDASESDKRAALVNALQYYEERLVGPYLVGEQFTLADANAAPFFERLLFSCRRFKDFQIPSDMGRLRAWLDLVLSRPSFLATKRPEEKLEEVYQLFLQRDYKFGGLNRN